MAQMTIRRFGVLSVAKMYGFITFIFGLIIGVIYGLIFIIFGAAMSLGPGGRDATAGGISSAVIGVLIMIGLPLAYGFFGFVAGAIGALVYNALAGIVGGVKLDLEGVQQEYAPPPPQQWGAA